MKITTAKQTSVVTNKEQYYVILETKNIRYTMSVGQKSYDTINQMLEESNNVEPLDLKDENKKLDNLIKTKKPTK